jgi:hypothetical protein
MRCLRRYILGGLLSLGVVACGFDASAANTQARATTTTASSRPSVGGVETTAPDPSPTPALFATGCGEGLADLSGPLTGAWRGSDGGTYYLRQAGDCLWWFGTHLTELEEAGGQLGWANVAVGRIVGDEIYIEWSDVPLGTAQGRGTLVLRVSDHDDRIEKIDAPHDGGFGGSFWDRIKPGPSSSQP